MENKLQKKENNKLIIESEVESKLNILVKGQTNNSKQLKDIRDDLQRGFIGLALRNQELTQQLDIVVAELNQIKQERQEKEIRKKARANRKRLPKRDPMTREIYNELIKAAEGPTYINLRTRIALCILAITGIRINELLPLKVEQLQTLVQESWIEFVKQTIGHRRLDTTSAYVNKLSDQERRARISQLD